jgi:hypothetical protein
MLKDGAEGQIRSWESGKTDSRDGKCDFDVPTIGRERETLLYSPPSSSFRRLGVAGDKQDKAEMEGCPRGPLERNETPARCWLASPACFIVSSITLTPYFISSPGRQISSSPTAMHAAPPSRNRYSYSIEPNQLVNLNITINHEGFRV